MRIVRIYLWTVSPGDMDADVEVAIIHPVARVHLGI